MFYRRNTCICICLLSVIIIFPVSKVYAEEMQANPPDNKVNADGAGFNKLDIYEYLVKGNTVLTEEDIEGAIYPYLGQDKSPDDVDNARSALEKLYQDKGYKTVQVLIPKQTVKNGVVNLQVMERRVGQLSVKGAKYTSVDRIKEQAPSFAEGNVPNFNEVNKDLITLNKSPDRRVSPALSSGSAPDTIDVALAVDEDLPIHGSLELNNRQSVGTTELRTSANVSYNNLWQRGHTISLSYQIAPQNIDDSQVIYGSYLAPIEDTRYSVLFNAIHTDSNVSTLGGIETLGKGDIFGIRGIASLRSTDTFNDSVAFGIDRKDFKQNIDLKGNVDRAPITYYPFSVTYTAAWRKPKSFTQGDLGLVFASRQLGDDLEKHDYSRPFSNGQQLALRFGLSNTYDFKNGIQLISNIKGQIADKPLLSYEQFSIGGVDTVRGYYESEVVGDYGVAGGFDLRSPTIFKKLIKDSFVDDLNIYGFLNAGSVHTKKAAKDTKSSSTISSTGLGLSFRVFKYVDGNVEWALPLQDGLNTRENDDRVLFQIKSSF